MWEGLFDKDENIEKNPLYYHGTLELEKANKELKRSLNAMVKFKDDNTSQDLLSVKDFAALQKGIVAYEKLLFKRKKALAANKERAANKKRKELRGSKWILSNFEQVDVEFMLKVIYANNLKYYFWNYDLDEIERNFNDILLIWGRRMKTKEDAVKYVADLYDALEDTSHKDYPLFIANVNEALSKHLNAEEF